MFGLPAKRRRVAFYSYEDGESVLFQRLERALGFLGRDLRDLHGWFDLLDGTDADASLYVDSRDGGSLTLAYAKLQEAIRAKRSQVLIMDSLADVFAGNENDRSQAKAFVRALRRLIPSDGAVLVIGHVNRSVATGGAASQGFSGSTGWHNAVRSRMYLRAESRQGVGRLILEHQKANWSALAPTIRFVWSDVYKLFVPELPPPATSMQVELGALDRKAWVLEAIRDLAASGNHAPVTYKGRRNALTVLLSRPGCPEEFNDGSAGKQQLRDAIESLRQGRAVVPGVDAGVEVRIFAAV